MAAGSLVELYCHSVGGQASSLYLDIKIKDSFVLQNLKKCVCSSPSIFMMILNQMFHFKLHPNKPEISTKILVCEKGGVINISRQAIVKVELTYW